MALHPKVTASVVSGAIVGLIIAEAKRRGVPIEPDEAADLTVLISAVAAWWVPSGEGNGTAQPAAEAPVPQVPANPAPAPAAVAPVAAPQVVPQPAAATVAVPPPAG